MKKTIGFIMTTHIAEDIINITEQRLSLNFASFNRGGRGKRNGLNI